MGGCLCLGFPVGVGLPRYALRWIYVRCPWVNRPGVGVPVCCRNGVFTVLVRLGAAGLIRSVRLGCTGLLYAVGPL